jgi:hypothetical protein
MATGFKLDIVGFEKQIEQKKKQILSGVIDGLKNGQDSLKNIMKFYIQKEVYDIYTPKIYDRTFSLKENVAVRVEGTNIYVYVDDSGMDKTSDGVTYPHRVLEGHDTYPYDFTPRDGSWAAYMNERNWIDDTRDEFVNHMNQSQTFLEIVRNAIQKRL